ncbi:MAG: hypothetical protein IPP42_22465 [Saprospiraceae bacterium]|nr:hypothetical protein [Saprospiraceae bacterium]
MDASEATVSLHAPSGRPLAASALSWSFDIGLAQILVAGFVRHPDLYFKIWF